MLIEKNQYISLANTLGVDITISPLLLAAARITRFVRSSTLVKVSFLSGTLIEAIEIVVSPNAEIANQPLNTAAIPENIIVAAIIRESTVLLPQQDTIIQPGDHLIAVGLSAAIRVFERLFE